MAREAQEAWETQERVREEVAKKYRADQKSEHKQLQWQSELGRQDSHETIAHAYMINSGQS